MGVFSVDRSKGESSPKTKEYAVWASMRNRCNNPNNHAYENYGGRGISVCERWSTYLNFLEDMGRRPTSKHSLDRVDNNGDYSKENCKWATRVEQENNKRSNAIICIDGECQTASNWSRVSGIQSGTILKRLSEGVEPRSAVYGELRGPTMLTKDGIKKSLREWCRIFGVNVITAHSRMNKGYNFEKIFTNKDLRNKQNQKFPS